MQIVTDTDRRQLASAIRVTRFDTAQAAEDASLAIADGFPCSAPSAALRLSLQARFTAKQRLCFELEGFARTLAA